MYGGRFRNMLMHVRPESQAGFVIFSSTLLFTIGFQVTTDSDDVNCTLNYVEVKQSGNVLGKHCGSDLPLHYKSEKSPSVIKVRLVTDLRVEHPPNFIVQITTGWCCFFGCLCFPLKT